MKFLITALRTGIPYGFVMAIYFWFSYRRPLLSISCGLLAGVLFGVIMSLFAARQRKRLQTERPNFTDEQLIHEGPANHFLNGEGVGGWLYLTSRRLLFRSHRVNLQPHETDLPLEQISAASPSRTVGFIPNGLLVTTLSGTSERFVVEGHKQWSEAITNAKTRNV